ncbi:hypothetical protein N431DRAFT_446277 [Stipitochalara longipes BDJ]|nr:hypothetical protein N431DRAFT_446277 [Stipitochalara longipes BDJ]
MSFFTRRQTGSTASSLISFYEGTSRDHRGRRLSEILQWGADRLESSHDYIQTVFPLPEASGMNWDAPIIDRQVFDAFRSRAELRGRLKDSFRKILWFYGFKLGYEDGKVKISKGDNYDEHSGNWNNRFDHNHLRITRIIRCLRVLGLEDEAKAFRIALENATTRVDSRSREFWRRAAERALNLRPDLEIYDEDNTTVGLKFLREFEVERQARLAAAAHNTQAQGPVEQHGEKEERQGLFEDEEVSDKSGQSTSDAAGGHLEQHEKKGLFEDEELSDKLDESKSKAAETTQEEQEWKGFTEEVAASEKLDQSRPKQAKEAEVAQNEERELGQKDNATDNSDRPSLRVEASGGKERVGSPS